MAVTVRSNCNELNNVIIFLLFMNVLIFKLNIHEGNRLYFAKDEEKVVQLIVSLYRLGFVNFKELCS